MFTLNYICENCNRSIRAQVTDGRVHPPPDICVECSNLDLNGGTGIKRRKKQVGDVVQGLLLEVFYTAERVWRVQCLFCLERALIGYNNIGGQKSCGCLKRSTLIADHFDGETVVCVCKECELRSEYNLLSGVPITCRSGCVKVGV